MPAAAVAAWRADRTSAPSVIHVRTSSVERRAAYCPCVHATHATHATHAAVVPGVDSAERARVIHAELRRPFRWAASVAAMCAICWATTAPACPRRPARRGPVRRTLTCAAPATTGDDVQSTAPNASDHPIPMLNNTTIAQLRAFELQGFADALQQQHEQAEMISSTPSTGVAHNSPVSFAEMRTWVICGDETVIRARRSCKRLLGGGYGGAASLSRASAMCMLLYQGVRVRPHSKQQLAACQCPGGQIRSLETVSRRAHEAPGPLPEFPRLLRSL